MGATTDILAMDERWLDAARSAATLGVRMAFERVVNVAPRGGGRSPAAGLLWIGASSCPFGPGALVLGCDELPEGLRDARAVRLSREGDGSFSLSIADASGAWMGVPLGRAVRIESCLLEKRPSLGKAQLRAKAALAQVFLARRGDPASPFLARADDDKVARATSRMLAEGGHELCRLMAEEPEDECALGRALLMLVGLGAGLTPSGDDFIVGALAVNRHLNPSLSEPGEEAVARALHGVSQRTTDVSRLYLLSAARSRFSECVSDAVRALALPCDRRVPASALERLLGHGSTSGTDTLAGMACMLKHLASR